MARIEGKIDAQMAARAERDKPIAMLAQRVAKSAEKAANVTTAIWLAAISVVLAVHRAFSRQLAACVFLM